MIFGLTPCWSVGLVYGVFKNAHVLQLTVSAAVGELTCCSATSTAPVLYCSDKPEYSKAPRALELPHACKASDK